MRLATIRELARYWATDYAGIRSHRSARVALMKRLGYTRYAARGGDWGAIITDVMAAQAPPGLPGVRSNMPGALPPEVTETLRPLAVGPPLSGLSADERRAYEQLSDVYSKGIRYAAEMGTQRQTLYGQADSSGRLYWENKLGFFDIKNASIPVAMSVFPGELYRAPRSWAERAYPKLIYFNQVDRGAHFAAREQPQRFSAEVGAAFRSLR